MNLIFVVDIDGTLADNSHRAALLEYVCIACGTKVSGEQCSACGGADTEPLQSSFDSFMDPTLIALDAVAPGAAEAIASLRSLATGKIVFLTGRRETTADSTKLWLAEKVGWLPGKEPLIMRSAKHFDLPASKYKLIQADKLSRENPDSSFMFFEDDPHIFDVFRRFGVVLKAPECWKHWNPRGSTEREPFYKR
jgi:hypothetical protein